MTDAEKKTINRIANAVKEFFTKKMPNEETEYIDVDIHWTRGCNPTMTFEYRANDEITIPLYAEGEEE